MLRSEEINIRDPFVLTENGRYYMYGTRAADFGRKTGGFDVYVSDDLKEWDGPRCCFDSEAFGFNKEVNWAPEVHKYQGRYFMFASFTGENGLRGTYALVGESPLGMFRPHAHGALTPAGWECIDGTFYCENGKPYLVFCHEHTQAVDGEICVLPLSDTLESSIGEPKLIFKASSPEWADKKPAGEHYVTDGPFLYRTKSGALLLIWSTFINHKYAQCIARSKNGSITGVFEHLPPLITDDGGHGMIFRAGGELLLTFHSPNQTGSERPRFVRLADCGDNLKIVK